MKTNHLLLAFMFLIILNSCQKAKPSDEINQGLIYTNYEMSYDATEDMTTVKANFRNTTAVGRQLKLSSPSEIRFNGEVLSQKTIAITNETYYEKKYNGYISEGVFRWTNANSKVYTNEIVMYPATLPTELEAIPNNSDYEVIWDGHPLDHDESVQLKVDVVGGPYNYFTQDEFLSNSLILTAEYLQSVAPGYAQLSLKRQYRPPLQEKTLSGGRITAVYTTAETGVDLLP